jgi:hypothetical protein
MLLDCCVLLAGLAGEADAGLSDLLVTGLACCVLITAAPAAVVVAAAAATPEAVLCSLLAGVFAPAEGAAFTGLTELVLLGTSDVPEVLLLLCRSRASGGPACCFLGSPLTIA